MSRLEPLPYYRWHWRDYRANRKVQRLLSSHVPRGLYRDLLDEQWAEGFIPGDDMEALADICFCPVEVIREHWKTLRQFFRKVDENVWVNDRMDRERTGKDAERVKRALAGQTGGKRKAEKHLHENEGIDPQANASTCHIGGALAEQEHKQEQEQEERATHAAPPEPTAREVELGIYQPTPENMPPIAMAKGVCEQLCLPDSKGNLFAIEAAIRAHAKGLARERGHPVSAAQACDDLIARAKQYEAQKGEKPDKWFFEDADYTRVNGNGKRTHQDELNERNRQNLTQALAARRRADQPMAGRDRAADEDAIAGDDGDRGTVVQAVGRLPPKRT